MGWLTVGIDFQTMGGVGHDSDLTAAVQIGAVIAPGKNAEIGFGKDMAQAVVVVRAYGVGRAPQIPGLGCAPSKKVTHQ